MDYYEVDRYTAKQRFIILLYAGGFGTWADEYGITKPMLPFIVELKIEISKISDKIVENNPELEKTIKLKYKPTKNVLN